MTSFFKSLSCCYTRVLIPETLVNGTNSACPIPSPKTLLKYPETQALLPSPDTYWHEGFGTKPGQDLGHPFVWLHRRSAGRGSLIGYGDLLRGERARGGVRATTPHPDVGGEVDEKPTPTSTGNPNSAGARCALRANGLLRNPSAQLPTGSSHMGMSGTRSRNEQSVTRRGLGKSARIYASSTSRGRKLPPLGFF
jgi:hypothetical protein